MIDMKLIMVIKYIIKEEQFHDFQPALEIFERTYFKILQEQDQ